MIQVWYHENCYDGFGSAWAARRALSEHKDVEYVACSYGKPMPNAGGNDDIYIVDFSFPREEMLLLSGRVKSLQVYDHHKTAEEALKGLDFAVFDMNRSGAGLTWDYLMEGVPRPRLIQHIEDRDLWTFKIDGSKEVHAYLCSQPFNFEVWDKINETLETRPDEVYGLGRVLLAQKISEVELTCKKAWVRKMDGYNVATVNTSAHWSEVGHHLLEKFPNVHFAASFTVFEDGVMWSLRGRGDFDVSMVAKKFGGGGHFSAAGFFAQKV